MVGPVSTIVEDKLYALHNPYELNGFVSSHPTWARGWAPMNSYLLVEGRKALLLDTGFSVHQESVLAQIRSVLPEGATLSVFPVTIGEFAGICNTRPIIETFPVDTVYGLIGKPAAWTDFRPEFSPFGGPVGHGALDDVGAAYVHANDVLHWSPTGRVLQAFRPALRLLPSHWCYDGETKTLFTGEAFNHVWRDTPEGPWVVDPDEAPPAFDDVWDFLTGSKYWWLPGANTEELLVDLRRVLDENEVEIIAPRHGCVIADPGSVRAHIDLLEAVLLESPRRTSTGVLAGAERMGG